MPFTICSYAEQVLDTLGGHNGFRSHCHPRLLVSHGALAFKCTRVAFVVDVSTGSKLSTPSVIEHLGVVKRKLPSVVYWALGGALGPAPARQSHLQQTQAPTHQKWASYLLVISNLQLRFIQQHQSRAFCDDSPAHIYAVGSEQTCFAYDHGRPRHRRPKAPTLLHVFSPSISPLRTCLANGSSLYLESINILLRLCNFRMASQIQAASSATDRDGVNEAEAGPSRTRKEQHSNKSGTQGGRSGTDATDGAETNPSDESHLCRPREQAEIQPETLDPDAVLEQDHDHGHNTPPRLNMLQLGLEQAPEPRLLVPQHIGDAKINLVAEKIKELSVNASATSSVPRVLGTTQSRAEIICGPTKPAASRFT